MTDLEHATQRLNLAEQVLIRLMVVIMHQMPPHAARDIQELGQEWNRELVRLDDAHTAGGSDA
jgi:hypothetical protein